MLMETGSPGRLATAMFIITNCGLKRLRVSVMGLGLFPLLILATQSCSSPAFFKDPVAVSKVAGARRGTITES